MMLLSHVSGVQLHRKRPEEDLSLNDLDKYEQDTDVNDAMTYAANIAGFSGSKQIKIQEDETKKL